MRCIFEISKRGAAVELTVEARLHNENSHNYNILSTFQSLVKPCFLPVYRLAIILIVFLIAAGLVRFLREHGQES